MGMLTKDDLKQIGEVMDDKLVEVLDAVNKGFSGVQGQINGLKLEVTGIKAVMVTKDYLDEKMGSLEGKLIAQDRKLEKKTDALIGTLAERRTLTPSDLERLEEARVFPRIK